ncbi:MAG: DUF72 domain-containing protein [Anaerolineales bacterium]|nr:DUF72 domain-containing protein [Anaerolineae bacterium]PWB56708.1 MAG: DUF72 domain-containing protein [Anaerolineales bacterium]
MDKINRLAMPAEQPIYYIGTSGWTYEHWKGRFYPPELPQKKWFDHYSSQFSAVEVNATFYRTFKDQTYLNWRQGAPEGFGYVLKAPKLITHRKFLLDVEQDIQAFYRSCTLLGDKFKMILLQVAPNMPIDSGRLRTALSAFPDPTRAAVEFRRSDWYGQDTMRLLEELGATLCNVDSPQHKLTDHLTSTRAYLRMHGRGHWYSYNYSNTELEEIARLAQNLAKKGARQVYVFFNNDFEGYAPANALRLKQLLE